MSVLTVATTAGAVGGVLVTGTLAGLFLRDPQRGLELTTHRAEKLPEVMTDRYIAFTVLAVLALIYQDLKVITALYAVFAYVAFHDAVIYARAGHPMFKHLIAGIAAAVVAVIALAAIVQTGAAA
ncbi:hypothetical protein [Acidimangrovimonas pyrenivorans]|uniref:MAPEG family protein n=1 Tax=Acidimangrovimonas pyrenivorans TaxID=2030798 RepID=A0ABV7AD17_9RHOB